MSSSTTWAKLNMAVIAAAVVAYAITGNDVFSLLVGSGAFGVIMLLILFRIVRL